MEPVQENRPPGRTRRGLAVAVVAVVLSLAACDPAPSADWEPQTAPGCSLTPTGSTLPRVTMADGRSYLLHVPAGLTTREDVGVPLLVSLHGLNSSAQQMSGYTGWQADAGERGYVVAYPESTDGSWEIEDDSADVDFVRRVAADVSANRCIDRRRVYATGHSLGAYLAQRLACDASDVIASVTAYAGGPTTLGGFGCDLARPVAVGLFHGESDRLVATGLGRQSRDQWVDRNGCDPVPEPLPENDGTFERYAPCDADVVVTWRSYPGQRHLWPTGARNQQMQDQMWALFAAHPLPA